MSNCVGLFFFICLFTPTLNWAKEKKSYFPLLGYTKTLVEEPFSYRNGIQIGIYGYDFPKYFSVELRGLSYWESWSDKVPIIVKDTGVSLDSSTKKDLEDMIDTTPKKPSAHSKATHSIPGLDSDDELTKNNWVDSPTKDNTKDKPSETLQQQTQNYSLRTTWVYWIGGILNAKWNLFELPFGFHVYWGPGLYYLYPLCKDMNGTLWLTLGVGARWIINSRIALNINYAKSLKKWGTNQPRHSLFHANQLYLFTLNVEWH